MGVTCKPLTSSSSTVRGGGTTTASGTTTTASGGNKVGMYTLRDDQTSMAKRMKETVETHGAAILSADAGTGKSLVQGAVTKTLLETSSKPAIAFTLFHTRKTAHENYDMFGIPSIHRYMTTFSMTTYCDKNKRKEDTHTVGMSASVFLCALRNKHVEQGQRCDEIVDDEDEDEEDEEVDEEMSESVIMGWLTKLKVKTVLLVIDECHTLTSQNSSRNCKNIDRLRKHLKTKEITFVVMGNSATPYASNVQYKRPGTVRANVTSLYGNANATDITVTPSEEERTTWTSFKWQGYPDNPAFAETHVLRLPDREKERVYDMFLNALLFTSPTSDGIPCEITDSSLWVALEDVEGYDPLVDVPKDVNQILHNADLRRARRKNHKDCLRLTTTEDDLLESKKMSFESCYIEVNKVYYTPKRTTEWKHKQQQRRVRMRLYTLFSLIELDAFLSNQFSVHPAPPLCAREKVEHLHVVQRTNGFEVSEALVQPDFKGCFLFHVGDLGAQAVARAKILELSQDSKEPVEWHDLTHDNRDTVDQRIDQMIANTKSGSSRLQIGLVSSAHTIGTNRFGKNVHGAIIVGGNVDETRKRHFAGRIARPVLPEVGDVFTHTPLLEHPRNKLLSNLQASMERANETITIDESYAELHRHVVEQYKDDAKAFSQLFDKATGKPFQILEGRDLAHEFVQALEEREEHHASHGSSTEWKARFDRLWKLMTEVMEDLDEYRARTSQKREASD